MKKTDTSAPEVQPTMAFPTTPQGRPAIDLQASWTYAQKIGELQQDGRYVSTGYSGASQGNNNPTMENVPNIGPIPRGDGRSQGRPSTAKITARTF